MSYYTLVDIQVSEDVDADAILAHARTYLAAQEIYSVEDVLEDLQTALSTGNCMFKGMSCHDFEGLMESVSAAFPTVGFYVRGMGEEFPDVWLRQFKGGKSSSAIGPFDIE
jgi:hypothetical protein